MDIKIDIDYDKADARLCLRERVGIRILLVIFRMVFPAKYDHQIDKAFAPLDKLLGD